MGGLCCWYVPGGAYSPYHNGAYEEAQVRAFACRRLIILEKRTKIGLPTQVCFTHRREAGSILWGNQVSADDTLQCIILAQHGAFCADRAVHIDVLDKAQSEIQAHRRGAARTEKRGALRR